MFDVEPGRGSEEYAAFKIPDEPKPEPLTHSERMPSQIKPVSDIQFHSQEGQVTWRVVYDDGSVSGWEMSPHRTGVTDGALEDFKKRKLEELRGKK